MKVTGKRAVQAVRAALQEAGLGRTSTYSGGEVTGWLPRNQYGSTGFSVRKEPDGSVTWHVVLSGKPHLRYRRWEQSEGDRGTISLHEPINPEGLHGRIAAAFESLGLSPQKVAFGGAQTYWDDDVMYNVSTDHPDWLGPSDPSNTTRDDADATLLKAISPSQRVVDIFPALRSPLVGYVREGRPYLTRESVLAIEAAAQRAERQRQDTLARYGGLKGATGPHSHLREKGLEVNLSETGALTLASSRLPETRSEPVTLTNHWGDEVQAWPLPMSWMTPLAEFTPGVPFLLDGEMRETVPFEVLDAQHGGDAPWLDAAAAGPAPR